MRTVLALDDLLAHAVAPQLPGTVMIMGRQEMRRLTRPVAQAKLRGLTLGRPSVLVIGARKWDPWEWLEAMQLPLAVPVVLLEGEHAPARSDGLLSSLGVVATVPAGGSTSGTSSCVADEALLAWRDRLGRSPLSLPPVRVEPRLRVPRARLEAVILREGVPRWTEEMRRRQVG